MIFLENIHLFNQGSAHENSKETRADRQDYYGNTALCSKVHRAVKMKKKYITD